MVACPEEGPSEYEGERASLEVHRGCGSSRATGATSERRGGGGKRGRLPLGGAPPQGPLVQPSSAGAEGSRASTLERLAAVVVDFSSPSPSGGTEAQAEEE